MKKLVRVFTLLVLAAGICLPGIAMADYTLSSTGTYWADPGNGVVFDRFDTYFTDTSTFSAANINGNAATIGYLGSFVSDGWKGTRISDTVSRATGPATTTLIWDYNFSGSFPGFPQRFDVNYFKDSKFVGHEGYAITAYQKYQGGFDMVQYGSDMMQSSVAQTPIPAAGWLLGTGLIGLIGVRRRFGK
jgi:hypothetical protein